MLKEGSLAIIRDAWKYKGRFHGMIGTIDHLYRQNGNPYGTQVAIRFDGIRNPGSSDGLFWFPISNIAPVSSKEAAKHKQNNTKLNTEEAIINMMKNQLFGGKIAKIRFLNGTNQTRTYDYALYDDFQVGDTVVVQTGHHGKAVAVIDDIIDQPPVKILYGREVVCVVDTTTYDDRQKKIERMRQLKSEMDERVQQLRSIAVYEMMAERDDKMRELLTEFNALGFGQPKPAQTDDSSKTDESDTDSDCPNDNTDIQTAPETTDNVQV